MIAHDATAQFCDAIRHAGLAPPDSIHADGKLHRFASDGRRGDDAGWYVLYGDGVPAGSFGCWRTGLQQTWRAEIGRKLAPAEIEAQRQRVEQAKRLRDAELERRRAEAKDRARHLWKAATPGASHPYLERKGVRSFGVRVGNGLLLVPMMNGDGELCSVQTIDAQGEKLFLAGGQKQGCYHRIGKPNGCICIAEGYATAASIHEITGHAVAVAFDAGNLESVAKALRAKYPDIEITLCADHDQATEGNPGLTKATEAARAVRGRVAVPDFGATRPEGATDFNDLARVNPEAVKRSVANARRANDAASPEPHASVVQADLARPQVVVRRFSEIQAKPIHWLWPGRIARGKVSMIAGHPGLGKSQLTAALAAVVSTGGRWPVDGTRCDQGSVLFLNAEDAADDTIRPRLEAAGADLARCEMLDAVVDGYAPDGSPQVRGFNLKADLRALGALLEQRPDAALVIIDPITAYLGGVDSHVNSDVRAVLAPLSDLASKHDVAVVCVSHLNKGGPGKASAGDAMLRVSGSLAFVAASRAAYIVARDQDDPNRRLFLPAKNNIGKDATGLAFAVQADTLSSGIETSKVMWEPHLVTISADEAMAPAPEEGERSMTDEALDFLRTMLTSGRVLAREVKKAAQEAGISDKALRVARERLGVVASRDGFGSEMKSYWALGPAPFVPSESIHALQNGMARMGTNGTNGAAQEPVERF